MSPDTTAPAQLGNYDIVSKIADGGMGTVYKARNRITGEIVAVKVIAQQTAKNPILLQRFEREFVAARVLDHPNVVKAIEYCGAMPYPFLVMEYVDGDSLGQIIERQGAVAEAEAVRIIGQVCEGLQRAHKQGLVHRDVKPDNILLTREGLAKLTDMGLVKDVEGDLNLTKTGRGLGTPHYMAPEQFRNAKTVDVRGDIYSLGATLYALVTGTVPFENASPLDCWMKKIRNEFPAPRDLCQNLSDRVDWAIRRAIGAEPDRRPASCREFLEDLTGQSRMTPTRPMGERPSASTAAADVWYMVYRDETGATHTVKGSTEGIRKALKDSLLGDAGTILVSRTKTGQFLSLASVPQFRDLVVNPAPLSGTGRARNAEESGILAKASGVVPQPTTGRLRRPTDDADVDLRATPAATGAPATHRGNTPSDRQTVPTNRQTPTSAAGMRRTPHPVADPHADTTLYASEVSDDDMSDEDFEPRPHNRTKQTEKKPFDWTPVLIFLVMLLSAAVGYLILTRGE